MYQVEITTKADEKFSGSFETKSEAESWIANHKRKGRDSYTATAETPFPGAKDIKKVKGIMGADVYQFTVPAEYTVEIKELGSALKTETQWQMMRTERNKLLSESDKTMLPDFPIDTKTRGFYRQFREYLRNLSTNFDDESIHRHKVMDYNEYCNFKKLFN